MNNDAELECKQEYLSPESTQTSDLSSSLFSSPSLAQLIPYSQHCPASPSLTDCKDCSRVVVVDKHDAGIDCNRADETLVTEWMAKVKGQVHERSVEL